MEASLYGTLLAWLIAGMLFKVDAKGVASSAGVAIEFLSSGDLLDRDRGVLDDPDQQQLPWPKDAIATNEKMLTSLEGGSRPEKVLFTEGVFVRKSVGATDSSAIMMEVLANDLYAVAGVKAPRCRYYPPAQAVSRDYMLCRWIDGFKPMASSDRTALYHASANFVLDAILQNYELWGKSGNLGLDGAGNMVRIDNGGSLAATGDGEWKRTVYNCSAPTNERLQTWSREPFSLWDMRSSGLDLYAHVTLHDIHGEALSVLRKKDVFLKVIDNFNSTIASKKIKRTLEARLDCLSRIIKRKVDLLDHVSKTDTVLPKEVCEGVRSICHDLLVDYL